MLYHKKIILSFTTLITVTAVALAQDTTPKTNSPAIPKTGTNAVPRVILKQADVASKTAKFSAISKTDADYKSALDAHALDAALKQADKDGAFKGKVTKIFEPRGGAMAMINFDENYKTALTALLRKDNFKTFPALTNLMDKEVVVSGKFINYQGRVEIILTNAAQVKLVE
jgi:hypothetical protein